MIQSKGGESIKGESLQDVELIEHGAHIAEAIGIVGPANVQCFREPDGSLPVTDVNPRFGGAFPLPLAAGEQVSGARARARPRRAARAAARGLPRRDRDDPLLLRLRLVENGSGELVPFAEELPHPIAAEPGEA